MEGSYALPVSAMHGHSHSASSLNYSPTKMSMGANTSRIMRSGGSSGGINGHSHKHNDAAHEHSQHGHHHSHSSLSPTLSTIPQTPSPSEHIHNHSHTHSHDLDDNSHVHPSQGSYFGAIEDRSHRHSHGSHDHHHHNHVHVAEKRSRVTEMILPLVESSPLLHSIMLEKDSRRLLYFMSLNFAFMMVQAFYGYVTDSLGLLSDSIHMFFDCLALAMGLFAAVSSKWPPSARFPYGFAKIESLSGFGNGVFLILISIEIMIEAIERLADGRETKRLSELLIVSSMGLAVNLVGMMAFGHHHHGHGHSHGGGSCSGGHDHGSSEKHDHSHDHEHTASCDHSNGLHGPEKPLSATLTGNHGHDHSHENQNMHGIFLHILADTMGSAAVIVSTLLIQFVGWSGWDPIASCIIAILIFLSSLPLVSSSAQQLLLTVPADTEYRLRNTLSGVSSLRGVASYSVPRFWMSDKLEETRQDQVLGVMHLIAVRGADVDDVRERARAFLSSHGMDIVIQVDREGEGKCWCGGDASRTPNPGTPAESGYRWPTS